MDKPSEEPMKLISCYVLIIAAAWVPLVDAAQSPNSSTSGPAAGPVIQIDDVNRFYAIYDAANGHPTAEALQHDYIDAGSEGLHHFARARNISGTTIAKALNEHPEIYSGARRCMLVLPRVRQRLET